jgi:hypothetical protein
MYFRNVLFGFSKPATRHFSLFLFLAALESHVRRRILLQILAEVQKQNIEILPLLIVCC